MAIRNNSAATNSALVLTPKGTGALIAGPKPDGTATGGNARGNNAIDLQNNRTASTQVAQGSAAIAIGIRNTSSNNNTISIGATNSSSGQASIAIGSAANASSSGSICLTGDVTGGSSTVSGAYAFGVGRSVLADRTGQQSYANGLFAVTGDAQRARFVLRCKTTTNTAVEMALDGATTYLSIPSGKVIACTINISGVSSTGGAVAHYVRQYAVKNVGGTSSEVYAPVTIGTDNAAGTVIALSANNADDTLRIAVTGIAAETWRWVASVDAVEIAYGT